VISRRSLLSFPILAAAGSAAGLLGSATACRRNRGGAGFRGYAFVANEEGQAIAAVDLETMAVARHIALSSSPSVVVDSSSRPFVYALTPSDGTIHEIAVDHLNLSRKLAVASSGRSMQISPDGAALYVIAQRQLIRVGLDSLRAEWKVSLPEEPVEFSLTSDGKTAAISSASRLWLVDLEARKLHEVAGASSGTKPDYGSVRFLADSKTLIVADRGETHRLSLYDIAVDTQNAHLISHLPLAVRPDHLCFNADGGQLFVTGEGMDAVVVVYPYHTPEVAETVLAGHAPGPMAASNQFLFVASPQSGDVNILQINSRKVIAVVSVGTDPGFIAVTPDDQYALVLNRQSGDVSVLRIGTITKNRDRRAALLTVIPVGSKPVSAVVRAV
jgi:DNA-binding beta-propeller fold protein YncE